MQLINILKRLLITISIVVLAACGSTEKSSDASAAETTKVAASKSEPAPDPTDAAKDSSSAYSTPVDSDAKFSEEEMRQLRENRTVYFDFDDSTVSSEYKETLEAHAMFLTSNPSLQVTIEGHADERGTPEYNIALGERRADSVAKYLKAFGVEASQISILSYGEEKPFCFENNETCWQQNRRAHFVLIK